MTKHVHFQWKSKEARSWDKTGVERQIKWQGSTVDHCDNSDYYSLLLQIIIETHIRLFSYTYSP